MSLPADLLEWFAIQVRPRWEQAVAQALESKGYECLLPLYERRRRWVDRIATIKEPLFPGYIFCHVNGLTGPRIVTTPGVIRLVGFGRTPIPVEESEILAVRRIVESGLWVTPQPYLRVGQTVRLLRGPLSGLEGILLRVRSSHRLVVSVSLLQRSVAVEIEDHWAAPQDTRRRPDGSSELASKRRLLRGHCA